MCTLDERLFWEPWCQREYNLSIASTQTIQSSVLQKMRYFPPISKEFGISSFSYNAGLNVGDSWITIQESWMYIQWKRCDLWFLKKKSSHNDDFVNEPTWCTVFVICLYFFQSLHISGCCGPNIRRYSFTVCMTVWYAEAYAPVNVLLWVTTKFILKSKPYLWLSCFFDLHLCIIL